jgi:alpha-N-arabinofuranosidase
LAVTKEDIVKRTAAIFIAAAVCALVPVSAWLPAAEAPSPAPASARLVIRADKGKETISRNIYGHFAEHLGRCIYGGIWVGESSPIRNVRGIRQDVVEALKAIKIPVLRWPGGCFADEYHWRDGIGPREARPTLVNTHWGGVTENNGFGTHEFLDLCEQLGCEPYICGNVGSGTVEEMSDWVEYITFDGKSPMADLRRKNGRDKPWKLRFFGVGNENWGCGGNMRAEYYADVFRRYATYVRNFGGNQVFKIACGPYGGDLHWTEVLMKEARGMAGLAPHYYCGTGKKSRSATDFAEVDWYDQLRRALEIEGILRKQEEVMDKADPENRVAIIFDEWGAWHQVEPGTNPGFLYQQNSLRDALVAGLTLNVFNVHARRVKMSNIAQTVNVLQAMVLTQEEDMILTPTYHVYRLFTAHHDATLLPAEIEAGEIAFEEGGKVARANASASRDAGGKIHVSLCNVHIAESLKVEAVLEGAKARKIAGQVLTAERITSHNTFEKPEAVKPAAFEGARPTEKGFEATLPPRSVVVLEIEV